MLFRQHLTVAPWLNLTAPSKVEIISLVVLSTAHHHPLFQLDGQGTYAGIQFDAPVHEKE
jgi:hypothetical protein